MTTCTDLVYNVVKVFCTGCTFYSQEMLQFLLLVPSDSVRILSARQTFHLLKILLMGRRCRSTHSFKFLFMHLQLYCCLC